MPDAYRVSAMIGILVNRSSKVFNMAHKERSVSIILIVGRVALIAAEMAFKHGVTQATRRSYGLCLPPVSFISSYSQTIRMSSQ